MSESRISLRFYIGTDYDLIILRYRLGRSFPTILTECIYAYINDYPYMISLASMSNPVPDVLDDIKVVYIPRNDSVKQYLDTVAHGKKIKLVKYLLRRANPMTAEATATAGNLEGVGNSAASSLPPSFFQISEEDRLIQEKQKELEALLKKKKSRALDNKIQHNEAVTDQQPERITKNQEVHIPQQLPKNKLTEKREDKPSSLEQGSIFGMATKLFEEY